MARASTTASFSSMPRTPGLVRRLVAAVMALLLATSALEGTTAHACPMHDGTLVAAVMGGAMGHSGHGGHAMPDREHGQRGGHQCTCPDTSCGTTAVALPAAHTSSHFGIVVADVRAVFRAPVAHRPRRVPHATPFANGPPAAALA